jgi:2-polyprenyl-3-methyl-5-hydroxy-6-metoxy-1,4-benzoquinol methylase
VTVSTERSSSTWVECARCGVHRIEPYPTPEELSDYYAVGYREADDFRDAGFAVSHKVRFSPEYRDVVFNEYRMSMADLGVTLDSLGDARVLDYGCADGTFLDYLSAAGVDRKRLTGVDISREMVDVVVDKGYRGFTADAFDATTSGSFDLICLWDVIEHVPSPRDSLTLLRTALVPGGRVLIQTPRIGLLAKHLRGRFEHYLPLEHLHLFPRETLTQLAHDEGFMVKRTRSFGANAPPQRIQQPYKAAYDALAKQTDNGATQLLLLEAR